MADIDSKTILHLFLAKNGWIEDLAFEKWEEFQKWQKRFARLCFLFNLMLIRYRDDPATSMLLQRYVLIDVQNFVIASRSLCFGNKEANKFPRITEFLIICMLNNIVVRSAKYYIITGARFLNICI